MATSPQAILAAGAFALAAIGLCNAPAFAAPEKNHPKAEDVLKAKKAAPAKSKKAAAASAEDNWANGSQYCSTPRAGASASRRCAEKP